MSGGARQRLGRAGEDRAAAWYESAGYEVLERNWRCRQGELDLVCRRGTTVVVCEVKTRASTAYGHPAEAVTPGKRRRLRRLALLWLGARRVRCDLVRFDLAAVLGDRVDVIEGAF